MTAFESRFGFARKDVTLANWRERPFSLWSFQNAGELVPSAVIRCADGLDQDADADPGDLLAQSVSDQRRTRDHRRVPAAHRHRRFRGDEARFGHRRLPCAPYGGVRPSPRLFDQQIADSHHRRCARRLRPARSRRTGDALCSGGQGLRLSRRQGPACPGHDGQPRFRRNLSRSCKRLRTLSQGDAVEHGVAGQPDREPARVHHDHPEGRGGAWRGVSLPLAELGSSRPDRRTRVRPALCRSDERAVCGSRSKPAGTRS